MRQKRIIFCPKNINKEDMLEDGINFYSFIYLFLTGPSKQLWVVYMMISTVRKIKSDNFCQA